MPILLNPKYGNSFPRICWNPFHISPVFNQLYQLYQNPFARWIAHSCPITIPWPLQFGQVEPYRHLILPLLLLSLLSTVKQLIRIARSWGAVFRPAKIVVAGPKLSTKMWLQAYLKKVFMPDTKDFVNVHQIHFSNCSNAYLKNETYLQNVPAGICSKYANAC